MLFGLARTALYIDFLGVEFFIVDHWPRFEVCYSSCLLFYEAHRRNNLFKMADHSGASNSNFDQNSERFEFVKEIIAAQLKSEGIKLWLSPYTQEETGEVDHFPLV